MRRTSNEQQHEVHGPAGAPGSGQECPGAQAGRLPEVRKAAVEKEHHREESRLRLLRVGREDQMIHWLWLLPALLAGTLAGLLAMALAACAGQADDRAQRMREAIPMREGERGREPD
jgi:hypothetical protein